MKKGFFRALFLTLCVTLTVLCLSACFSTVTVTFESEPGVAIETKEFKSGDKLIAPISPERPGYQIVAWMVGDTKWNFDDMTVVTDTVLVAKWEHTTHLFDSPCDTDCNLTASGDFIWRCILRKSN